MKAEFIQGQRVTDEATAKIVDDVLSGEINPEIVKTIKALGGQPVGFAGRDIFKCRKLWLDDRENPGRKIDIGYVGEVVEVNVAPLKECIWCGFTPVISPTARGEDGKIYNCNADVAAAQAGHRAQGQAARVHERRAGLVARSRSGRIRSFPHLKTGEVGELKKTGVIDKGMIPKVDSAVAAIQSGVEKVSFVDGRVPHAVLLEIFTDEGVGTEIVL